MSRYLELFKGLFDDSIIEKTKPENYPYVAYSVAENRVVYGKIPLIAENPENNEIWYTSSDENVVTPYDISRFGPNIVSNTYENGKGVIAFDGDVTSIGRGAFKDCASLTSITIPNSVTSIGISAFKACSGLTSITIPNSVTSIGQEAFYECSNLTSVDIPNGIPYINASTFYKCVSLTSLTIPNSVTSIGRAAFFYCKSLISITIPENVATMKELAIGDCISLTSISYEGTQEQWNTISKEDGSWNRYVPATYVQCTDGQVAL